METQGVTIENRVIMFMDVHNFSIAVNQLTEDLHRFLQELYQILGDIIVEHRGEIIKYLGDAILCAFPADTEIQAVQCALELRLAFSEIIPKKALPPDTELEIGIGSGEVALGVFGHTSLRQKDIFGAQVNLVARIGHHQGIAITERVYETIKTNYATRRLADLIVKWQDEPVKVWEVVT